MPERLKICFNEQGHARISQENDRLSFYRTTIACFRVENGQKAERLNASHHAFLTRHSFALFFALCSLPTRTHSLPDWRP